MIEFNPDGSLKLPAGIAKAKAEEASKFNNTCAIRITKEVVSTYAPKKCVLHLELSPKHQRNDFVKNLLTYLNAETPIKLIEKSPREFAIEVGTNFRRCTDCTRLVGNFREHVDGNLQLKKGNCTFEPRYFDDE